MERIQSPPAVSIIIPVYNRAKEIQRGLQSLVNQTFHDFEVLVCDDGSTDATEEVVATFASVLRIRYIKGTHKGGPAWARNSGWKHAQAPLIAFLDSDDWWVPQKLEQSIPFFDLGADLVYHPLIKMPESLHLKPSGSLLPARKLTPPVAEDLRINGNGIPNSSVIVRKVLLERVGGFREDERFIAWEDYDCWMRIAQVTQNFKCIESPLGYYTLSAQNLSSAQRILKTLDEMVIQYWSDKPASEIPYWIFDRKALAFYMMGHKTHAYHQKLIAFLKAPQIQTKWRIFKVLLKWWLYLLFK